MVRAQLLRVRQAGGGDQFGQRLHGVLVEVRHARNLVVDHQRALALRVLRGHARGAAVRVAALRLDAAQREHEAARRIAPVGAQRQQAGDVEGRDDLARAADLDLVAQVGAHQGVMHQHQRFLQRRAHVVREFHGRGARAPFAAVDDDEVGRDAGFQHGLDDAEEFPRVADGQLEAGRLAAR